MIAKLARVFTVLCVGTCVTQMILVVYFLLAGSLNRETGVKVISLLNGIDITGDQLQQIMQAAEDREQPDFSEILQERTRTGLNMDLRRRSQMEAMDELSKIQARLMDEAKAFDQRREAFLVELDKLSAGAKDEGLQNVQRIIQSLEPEQSKDQLLRMYAEERIDEVVSIVQAMPPDIRSEILAEFDTDADREKLHEILRRIGQGLPTTALIKKAKTAG